MTVSASCDVAGAERDLLDVAVEVDADDVVEQDLGAEALGLLLHLDHEVGALDALGEAREVLDLGGLHELTAGLDGAGDDERRETRRARRRCAAV